MSVSGRTIVLAGATSDAGRAIARTLVDAGAHVIATGRSLEGLAEMSADIAGVRTEMCDVTDATAVTELAARVGPVDGVIPLVGGWRGGGGLAGQTDDDYRVLEPAFTAVRNTSRAFDEALRSSDAGRFAIVSSTAAARPLAGGANYAAVKAASEAWARAVAHGYAKAARDAGQPLRAASVIFRAKALDPNLIARAIVDLWDHDAIEFNDSVRELA